MLVSRDPKRGRRRDVSVETIDKTTKLIFFTTFRTAAAAAVIGRRRITDELTHSSLYIEYLRFISVYG